jgi:hypothetical protein
MTEKPYWNYSDISARLWLDARQTVSVTTLRQWRARGKMPEPDYKPSPTLPLWKPETIGAWIERLTDESD